MCLAAARGRYGLSLIHISGELTHQDLGQMQMYVNYYTRELMNPGDNPPVGIVLCAEKNDAVVRYKMCIRDRP